MSDHVFKVVVSGGSFYYSCRPCLPREYVVQYWRGHESVALPGTKLFCFQNEYDARGWAGEEFSVWRASATGVVKPRGRSLPHLDDPEVIEEWWSRTLSLPPNLPKFLDETHPDSQFLREYDTWLNEHSGFPQNVPQEYPPGTLWADTLELLYDITRKAA